jgi:AbrB family looped-hinge helix DNA binding protein
MHRVRIGRQGRLVVPAELRRQLGIRGEDDLVAWIDEGRLVFQRRADIEREIRELVAHVKVSLSEELIRERRREAAREP